MFKYLIYVLAAIGGIVVVGLFQIFIIWTLASLVDKYRKNKED